MADAVEQFADHAKRFRTWVLCGTNSGPAAARTALELVSRLYLAALALPPRWCEPEEGELGEPPPPPGWQAVYSALVARLPFQHYGGVFNPLPVPPEQPLVGDIADDLADIFGDVDGGLRWFEAGNRAEAVWQWGSSWSTTGASTPPRPSGRYTAGSRPNTQNCWRTDPASHPARGESNAPEHQLPLHPSLLTLQTTSCRARLLRVHEVGSNSTPSSSGKMPAMRKRWVCLCFGGCFLLLVGVVTVALLEPTYTFRGLLFSEPFYRERSASYWREVLREDGRNGLVSKQTAGQLWDTHAAFPVLRQCAGDPDRNVRWPTVTLLAVSDLRTQQVLDVLVEALGDDDVEVRLKAVAGLSRWGQLGRQAIPALTARLSDPELQVAHSADLALWQIDLSAAPSVCGWRPFKSTEFGVSAMLPGKPEEGDKPVLDGLAVAHSFQLQHHGGAYQSPTRYVIAVTTYPEEFLKGATEEERFRGMKDAAPFFMRAKVVEEKKVSLGDLTGREYLLEVEKLGRLRSRHFWSGTRLYSVMVVYKPEFLNARAADYFLDSFRVEGQDS